MNVYNLIKLQITGAGHGMGREMALRFGRLGSIVVCVDINPKGNEETADIVKQNKGKAHTYKLVFKVSFVNHTS